MLEIFQNWKILETWEKSDTEGCTLFLFPDSERYNDPDGAPLLMAKQKKGKKFSHWWYHWATGLTSSDTNLLCEFIRSSNKCFIISTNFKMGFLLLAARIILIGTMLYEIILLLFFKLLFLIKQGIACSLKK